MRKGYLIASSLISIIILYIIEQILGVNYLIKTISKILLFILVPLFYLKFIKRNKITKALNLRKVNIKLGLLLGTISFVSVIIAYFIFKGRIDNNSIIYELQSKSKINKNNFILVGTYITLANSFLEEFFFRGFIFLNLFEEGYKKTAYIFSALLFSLYHITIFKTWFNIYIMLIAILGLFSIGIIFNYIDTLSKNFLNSWIVHIFADIAIILIGISLFEII